MSLASKRFSSSASLRNSRVGWAMDRNASMVAFEGSVSVVVSMSRAMHASSNAVALLPRNCARSVSGAVTSIERMVFIDAVVALTAPALATLSARIDSMGPSPCLGSLSWCRARTARAAASASMGSLLPLLLRSLRFGRGTSTVAMWCRRRCRLMPAPYEEVPSMPTEIGLPCWRSHSDNSSYPSAVAQNWRCSSRTPVSVRTAAWWVSAWVSIPQ